MTMTVRELIEALEQFDDDTEVRLAFQPSWPFEYSLGGEVVLGIAETVHDFFLAPEDGRTVRCTLCDFVFSDDQEIGDDETAEQRMYDHLVTAHAGEVKGKVYLAEESQIGYLPDGVTRTLGWGRNR